LIYQARYFRKNLAIRRELCRGGKYVEEYKAKAMSFVKLSR